MKKTLRYGYAVLYLAISVVMFSVATSDGITWFNRSPNDSKTHWYQIICWIGAVGFLVYAIDQVMAAQGRKWPSLPPRFHKVARFLGFWVAPPNP